MLRSSRQGEFRVCRTSRISLPSAKSRRRKTRCKAARRQTAVIFSGPERRRRRDLALARLETALHLVDHVNPALAADQTVVAVAATQRFQRVTDLHGTILELPKGRARQAESGKMGFIPLAAVPPETRDF